MINGNRLLLLLKLFDSVLSQQIEHVQALISSGFAYPFFYLLDKLVIKLTGADAILDNDNSDTRQFDFYILSFSNFGPNDSGDSSNCFLNNLLCNSCIGCLFRSLNEPAFNDLYSSFPAHFKRPNLPRIS